MWNAFSWKWTGNTICDKRKSTEHYARNPSPYIRTHNEQRIYFNYMNCKYHLLTVKILCRKVEKRRSVPENRITLPAIILQTVWCKSEQKVIDDPSGTQEIYPTPLLSPERNAFFSREIIPVLSTHFFLSLVFCGVKFTPLKPAFLFSLRFSRHLFVTWFVPPAATAATVPTSCTLLYPSPRSSLIGDERAPVLTMLGCMTTTCVNCERPRHAELFRLTSSTVFSSLLSSDEKKDKQDKGEGSWFIKTARTNKL